MKNINTKERSITPRETVSIKKFLEEIRNYKTLSVDEEVELFKRYSKTQDERLLDEITKHNLKFVVSVAKQYIGGNIPFEDLVSTGNIGLIRAIKSFDYNRGFKFSSHAVWFIKAEIITSIIKYSKPIRIPSNVLNTMRKVEEKIRKSEEITEEEQLLLSQKEQLQTTSLNKVVNGEDFCLTDMLEDKNSILPTDDLYIDEKKSFTKKLLSYLDSREFLIFKSYYGLEETQCKKVKEIGLELGISENSVRNIRDRALFKLKRKLGHDIKIKNNYHLLFLE